MAETLNEENVRLRAMVVEMATMLADLATETDRGATARRARDVLAEMEARNAAHAAPPDFVRLMDDAFFVLLGASSELMRTRPPSDPVTIAASAINGTVAALKTTLVNAAIVAPSYGRSR